MATPTKHSKFGASSCSRWRKCPASIYWGDFAPKKPASPYAAEGTAAHELGETALLEQKDAVDYLGREFNGFTVTEEMADAVQVYLDVVRKYLAETKGSKLSLEGRFDLDKLFEGMKFLPEKPNRVTAAALEKLTESIIADLGDKVTSELNSLLGSSPNKGKGDQWDLLCDFWQEKGDICYRPNAFGTNDACVYALFGDLIVVDYKHGKGVPVSVEGNDQLIFYAVGAALRYNFEFSNIKLVVVQPRCDQTERAVQEWVVSRDELRQYADRLREDILTAAKDKGNTFKTGDHCRWCPANIAIENGTTLCPALKQKIIEVSETNNEGEIVGLVPPDRLTPDQIARVLNLRSVFKTWLDDVWTYAVEQAKQGNVPTGYKLVEGKKGNTSWRDAKEAERFFANEFGELAYNKKLKTPTQMLKIAGKEVLENMTFQPAGKPTLVPESSKKPAIEARKVEGLFSPSDKKS